MQLLVATLAYPFAATPTAFEQNVWQIAALSNIPTRELAEASMADIARIAEILQFAKQEPAKVEPINRFTFEGVEYECANPFDKDMLGKWITLEYMIMHEKEIIESLQNGKLEKLPLLIAALVHPVAEDYRSDEVQKRRALFERLPVLTALGVRNFFLQKLRAFKKSTEIYIGANLG
jgi:hypothetical protein